MKNAAIPVQTIQFNPPDFRLEALAGLTRKPKSIPPKFLYDEIGSRLFEEICALDEYYPTRVEDAILRENADEIARLAGPGPLFIEPGSGSARKIRILLERYREPVAYVPIEISESALVESVETLRRDFRKLSLLPIHADYSEYLPLPPTLPRSFGRRVVFFPGSTIGNLDPLEARLFLCRLAVVAGEGGGVLVGVDTKKDPRILQRAYDDSQGVTAEFNLNLLRRMNDELEATFDRGRFAHQAIYDEAKGRIEMHLVSLIPQIVRVAGKPIRFTEGETIHTESSYKYRPEEFLALARETGLHARRVWTDAHERFALYYFEATLAEPELRESGTGSL